MNEFIKRAEKHNRKKAEKAETDIEKTFVKYAEKRGCKAYKLIFLLRKGFPDRTVLCPGGRVFFIEFKRKNKTPTPAQISVRDILTRLGFEYYICDEPGQAEKTLDEFLDWW